MLLALACSTPPLALAQAQRHIVVSAISPLQQRLALGQSALQPFVARVTDDTGAGVAGVSVLFFSNGCSVFSDGQDTCPPPTLYGHFAGDGLATSDAHGYASLGGFSAGTSAGNYAVAVMYSPWNQVIDGVTLTDEPLGPGLGLFAIGQPDPAFLPALSDVGLMVLAIAVGGMALRQRRAVAKR